MDELNANSHAQCYKFLFEIGRETVTSASQLSRIAVNVQPPVARISLVNPPVNVIDIAMMEELAGTLAEIEMRSDISILMFRGSAKCFSAGVDVAAHTPDKIEHMLRSFHALILGLVNSSKVSIAVVDGHCLGGGTELAMVCDLVYTSESAVWGFPEIKLGCYPPVAVTALAPLVGQKQASDLILTGRTICGREAASIGLANRSINADQLDAVVQETVERLMKHSSSSLAITKKAIYAWDSIHFDKGLARAEKIYLEELMKTRDAQEGIEAFLQRREPAWNSKDKSARPDGQRTAQKTS
ncbi:MAG: enoyl-CoA hydratase [Terriglobales bacterium]